MSELGECIIPTRSLVPGATIHAYVFVGADATIVADAKIGEGASIGAGSVVLTSVEPGVTVLGNPAEPVQVK